MMAAARRLGFSVIGLTLQNAETKLPRIKPPEDLKVVWRVDLKPVKAQPSFIAGLRRKFSVIAISCSSRRELRMALKTRADLVFQSRLFTMNLSDARVLADSGKFFELNLRPLIHPRGLRMANCIKSLRENVKLLMKLEIPVIVSSWASNTYELTPPLELPQHLALADVDPRKFYQGVSKTPARLLEFCESKRVGLPEGVRILEG